MTHYHGNIYVKEEEITVLVSLKCMKINWILIKEVNILPCN
jgi:hypothetical protein